MNGKMTKRVFLTAVSNGDNSNSVREYARERLALLDCGRPAAKINSEAADSMFALMEANRFYTASELAIVCGYANKYGAPNASKVVHIVDELVQRGLVIKRKPAKSKPFVYQRAPEVVEDET